MAQMYSLQKKERKKSRTREKMRKRTMLPKPSVEKEISTNQNKKIISEFQLFSTYIFPQV
jgi:hypothetical protein